MSIDIISMSWTKGYLAGKANTSGQRRGTLWDTKRQIWKLKEELDDECSLKNFSCYTEEAEWEIKVVNILVSIPEVIWENVEI